MTEKEKMLAGMIYDANYDKDLMQERLKCKDLCYEFNQLRPSRIEEQTRLIREIFGKTKESFYVLSHFYRDWGKLFYESQLCYSGLRKGYLWR